MKVFVVLVVVVVGSRVVRLVVIVENWGLEFVEVEDAEVDDVEVEVEVEVDLRVVFGKGTVTMPLPPDGGKTSVAGMSPCVARTASS